MKTAIFITLVLMGAANADDFASQLQRIPATKPTAAIEAMQVADGFHVELAASEPNIGTPVDIGWDAKGRMFVCEMKGYSELRDQKLSRVSRLEDLDADGFYETAQVFADELLWPTAVFPYRDGLFVADAPNIYYFRDTDDDGVADHQQIVLTGFGTQNVQGLLNSFRWGLDNHVHVACSSNGGRIHRPGQASDAVEVRGRDIAFDPDTFAFRVTNGGSQNGMSFDDWGNKYASSNSDHLQAYVRVDAIPTATGRLTPAPARLSIATDGPQAEVFRRSQTEPWRVLRTQLRVSGLASGPIEGGGRAAGYFTGATGATIYRGDAWPAENRGVAFVGDVGSNLIHRKEIDRTQFRPTANRIDTASEFIASSDNWFRPAQFANGPDGNLYVVDVCREVIEHPKSLPPNIKQHLDLNSGRDLGRIFRIVANGTSPRRRVNLSDATTDELVATLAHPNAWHRETASRLLLDQRDKNAVAALRSLAVDHPSSLGRLHARYVLAGFDALTPDVLRAGFADRSAMVRMHSLRFAAKLPMPNLLKTGVTTMSDDASPHVRYECAVLMRRVANDMAADVLADMIRRDAEIPWFAAALLVAAKPHAGDVFASLYNDDEFDGPGDRRFLEGLALEIGRYGSTSEKQSASLALLSGPRRAPTVELPILQELLHGSDDARLTERRDVLEQTLRDRLTEPNLTTDQFKEVLASLGNSPSDESTFVIGRLIGSHRNAAIHSAAADWLSDRDSDQAGRLLFEHWNKLTSSQQRRAITAMWTRANHQSMVIDAMKAGDLSETSLTHAQWTAGLKATSHRVALASREYLASHPPSSRAEVIADYQQVFQLEGDDARGKLVFEKNCSTCHRVAGLGHEFGPNLAAFSSRGMAPILVNVLDPNREINPQYLNYTILTTDGRVMSGMIQSEDSTSVTIVSADGKSTTIARDSVDQLQSGGVSFMPEGFEDAIDHQAMADLIAYLTMSTGASPD